MPIGNSSSSSTTTSEPWILNGLTVGAVIAVAVGAHIRRFASSRFQGKSLFQILGKLMSHYTEHLLQRTWDRAKLATSLDHVGLDMERLFRAPLANEQYAPLSHTHMGLPVMGLTVVATDDEKIADCCQGFGAHVIMTSKSCRNGTERCNEALQKLDKKYDIVFNIQGDEPLIEPEIIDGIVKGLQAAPDAVFSTAVTSLKPEDAFDPNRVKCMVRKVKPQFPYLLHFGIQSYDSKFLRIYLELPPTPLQLEEDLEQLKALENGYKMKVIKVDHNAHGVDTP